MYKYLYTTAFIKGFVGVLAYLQNTQQHYFSNGGPKLLTR